MNRRFFLLGVIGAAAGSVALSSAQAAPATVWDDLQALDGAAVEDIAADGASDAQYYRRRAHYRGRPVYRRPFRGRGYAYGRYRGPRRRWAPRRVCRIVRNRRGVLVRRCW